MELASAGMSGGSPEAVEHEWTMPLYQRWLDNWEKWGPPAYISAAAVLGLPKKKGAKRRPKAEGRRGLPPPPDQDEIIDAEARVVRVGDDPAGFIQLFTAAGGRMQ